MTITDNFFMAEDAFLIAKSKGDTLAAIRWAIILDTLSTMEV